MKVMIVAGLTEFGGVENEVALIAETALKANHKVFITSTNYISEKSSVKVSLEKYDYDITSIFEFYYTSFFGRLNFLLAYMKFLVRNKRRPKKIEKNRFCSVVSKQYRDNFWDSNKAKKMILNSDSIIIVGQPLNIFMPILKIANNYDKELVFRITGSITEKHLKNKLYKKFILNINFITKILVHSNKNKQLVKDVLSYNGEISIIDQYAENEDYLLSIPRLMNVDETVNIGILSRLTQDKGISDVIIIFSELIKIKKLHLFIGGDGDFKGELEELVIKLGLETNISFLGYIENKKKEEFYKKIDIFVISSIAETGPITGVESMAAGAVLISTKVGAMPERLQNISPSFIYEVGNKNEMKNKLKEAFILIKDERYKDYVNQLRQTYCELYSKTKIIDLYKEIFKREAL